MRALSLDLRERIVAACDRGTAIQRQIAERFEVSLGMVKKPDLTLKQLRDAIDVDCTIQPIHYVLADMGLTYKKRPSELVGPHILAHSL